MKKSLEALEKDSPFQERADMMIHILDAIAYNICMETKLLVRNRKIKNVTNPIMKASLVATAVAGLAGLIVVAPNGLAALDMLAKQVDKKNERKKRTREQLKNSGYFSIEDCGDGRYAIKLTSKGEQAASNVLYDDYELPKGVKWDGKWRLFMFDIAERHKYLRDLLTNKVSELGLLKIQNSVYVYPYSLDDFTKNLQTVYPEAMQYVMCVEAEKIQGQEQLVKKFVNSGVL